jgi:hypothetical protein
MAKENTATIVTNEKCVYCGELLRWTPNSDGGGKFSCSCGYEKVSRRQTCPDCGQPMYFLKHLGPEGSMFGLGVWSCEACGHRHEGQV